MKFIPKITKKELAKSLLNTKINISKEHYEKFQLFLFDLGFEWEITKNKIKEEYHPYLYISSMNKNIRYGDTETHFKGKFKYIKILYEDYKQYIK